MADKRIILVCSCENTMPLDEGAIRRGCHDADVLTARQLCRTELDRCDVPAFSTLTAR